MDKQEYREFLEEIKKGYNARNYEQVAAYADELDFGKIKDPRTLEMISDSYDQLGETDNAIDALVAAFARNKTSKQIAYKLGELCLKAGDLDGAVEYYEAYRRLASNNSKALLLKYEIGKAGGVPAKELVRVLESYTAREKDEKWEYELARLYHETGQIEKCVETCDNIFLWYSGGEYVKKALELKFSHTPLTREQQIRYEQMMQEFLDPSEMTKEAEPEEDEVALELADEYLNGVESYEKQMEKAEAGKYAADPDAPLQPAESLQDTMVIPIKDIIGEIESGSTAEESEDSEEAIGKEEPAADAEEDAIEGKSDEVPEETAETPETEITEQTEPQRTPGTITFEELRAMIHDGNRKQAQSGLFFTYNEPTAEEIAEEEALKSARAEARRRAEEEAARKAAEEAAAREAAAAAAREAARLEEEARVEAALRIEEESRKLVSASGKAESQEDPAESTTQRIDPDMEIDETKFINRNELLARLDEADRKIELEEQSNEPGEEISAKESLGFTAIINAIADEVDLDEVTAKPEVIETKEDDEVGATQIFSREELDTVLSGIDTNADVKTPEQQLGAAIEQIMDDANATVARDMEETKSIRIVLPVASANKLGLASAKLSQYASSVVKPELEHEAAPADNNIAGAPRIIDNVDFSYIPVSSDEDGQLGLNIEYLTLKDEFEVEGQLTIDDVLKSYSRKLKLNQAKVLDVESERLRKIQEAVNLTAPVKLPYSMDDLMFDDIEISNIDGKVEEVEGDVFQFDPESIGVIPSDEELLATLEAEEAAAKAEQAAAEGSVAEEEISAEEETAAEEAPIAAEEIITIEEPAAEEKIPAEEEPIAEEELAAEEEIPSEEEIFAALEAEATVGQEAEAETETEAEIEAEAEPEAEVEAEIEAETEIEQEEDLENEPEAEEPADTLGEEYLPKEGDILAAIAALEAENANAVTEDEIPSEDEIFAALEAESVIAHEEPEAAEAADEEAASAEEEAAPAEEPAAEAEPEPVPEEEPAAEAEPEPVPEEEPVVEEEPVIDEEIVTEETDSEEGAVPEWGEELSEAEKAIAAFDMNAVPEELGEAEKAIDDELFDVMAELGQTETAEDQKETEEVLESDAFEEMFGELMSDEPQSEEEPAEETSEPEEAPSEEMDEELSEEAEETEEIPVITSASGYSLPDDVRKRLSEFLLIDGMEQQIVDVISTLIERKKAGDETAGNLIVTGDIKSGKTFLAIEIIKAVTEEFGSTNGKVAKVQAELLNGKNIEKVFEKIGGSDLIIENVGYLDDETIESLTDVISRGRFTTMVIIEGNQLAVESITSSFPEFGSLFENRIDINELSIVQWADVAMQYADEKGFVLDDMAKLALHAKINEINIPTARLGYDEVMDIMDDAIARAEKRNSGRLFAAFKKGEDEKREIIESDFM